MKLNIDLGRLEAARRSIGAPRAAIGALAKRRSFDRSPLEIELIDSGSIILSDKELEEVLHFPGGLAAIGNTQITLHIFQPFNSEDELSQSPAPAPKFHVADCSVLETMRQRGRFNRYVSTANATGYFRVEPWDHVQTVRGEEMEAHLAPCIVCLKQIDYGGFETKPKSVRDQIVANFNIEEFFSNYEPIFRCMPLYTPDNFPEGNYSADWARISEQVRMRSDWTCGSCGVELSDHRSLLHVHHRDGNRGNNRPSNLVVLCCLCHSAQPFHEKMYVRKSDRELLEALRRGD